MKQLRVFFALSAFAGTLLVAATSIAITPPRTISVGGYLADPAGAPLEGAYTFRIDFYGNADGTVVDTMDTTATLTAGVFSVPVEVADPVLDQPEISYRVWVDVDRDGLTDSDRFPDLFKLSAVPRAHRVSPQDRLLGTFNISAIERIGYYSIDTPTVALATIDTANSVTFNTITYKAYSNTDPFFQAQNETHYEVGIYDFQGDLLVKSRSPLNLTPFALAGGAYTQVVVPRTTLPAGVNFTAITSDIKSPNRDRFVGYLRGVQLPAEPFAPARVAATIPAPGGQLPNHVENIATAATAVIGPVVTLKYLPEAESLPIGAYRRATGESSYEWIAPSESFY